MCVASYTQCLSYSRHNRPGTKNYSRLSVNTQLVADVRDVLFIPRSQFRPPPKVDCIVSEIIPREPPLGIDMTVRRCVRGCARTQPLLTVGRVPLRSLVYRLGKQ